MLELFREVVSGLKKNPLPTFCGLLGAAVVYLWLHLLETKAKADAKDTMDRAELIKCVEERILVERRCSEAIDSIRRTELRKTEAQIKEMEQIIKQYKRR